MDLITNVDIPKSEFKVEPDMELLFVGSCFADNIGNKFEDNHFHTTINPYGVMYNPSSVCHTIEKYLNTCQGRKIDVAVLTLGTNHVYIDKATGEVVYNCQKRPQNQFREEKYDITLCHKFICNAVNLLMEHNGNMKVFLTVSPIRYAKYGYHESQLSKATLLLAAEMTIRTFSKNCIYFPAYEIMNDELRDYRFYAPDMLHPSQQAVDYIWEKFCKTYMSKASLQMMKEWAPISKALKHVPINPEGEEYKMFLAKTLGDKAAFEKKWK